MIVLTRLKRNDAADTAHSSISLISGGWKCKTAQLGLLSLGRQDGSPAHLLIFITELDSQCSLLGASCCPVTLH